MNVLDNRLPEKQVILGAKVVFPDSVEEDVCVILEQGKISRIAKGNPPEDDSVGIAIEADGAYLAPGFIDLHIHGTGEYIVDDGPDALRSLAKLLPKYGVTGFLPTVCPAEKETHIALVAALSEVQSAGTGILGFFIEGPFLALPGSLSVDPDQQADIDWVSKLRQAASPYRAIFAVSPDFPNIDSLLPAMTSGGIPAFITHTRAGVADTFDAIEAGAVHATHFYDVFYVPDEKEPGVRPCGAVEAILSSPKTSVDFILDGEHVDPVAIKLALRCKGIEGVCLITDANRGAGSPPGKRYPFGDFEISFAYEGAPARLTESHPRSPGGLAGSGLTMDQAVRNAVKMLDLELPQAVAMASSSPAKVLGLEHRKGKIKTGYDADLVLLDATDLKPTRTWVGGFEVYRRDP